MPTYVYKCDSCGAQFEKLQSFKDEPLKICPACEGAVRRVLQPVGIVFKGSGWYITDSRKSSSATTNGDEKKTETTETKTEAPKTGESTSAKSEPASKPESAPASTPNTSASSSATA